MTFDPYSAVKLLGRFTSRCVTLAMPVERVRAMLPWGLELGHQDLTGSDSHPVRFQFNAPLRCHMNFPPGSMRLEYAEQIVGIPYVYRSSSIFSGGNTGPFYYMPRLWLDSPIPTLGGRFGWGMTKLLARFDVESEKNSGTFRVGDLVDEETGIISATWKGRKTRRPVDDVPEFARQREIMDQALVMEGLAGLAPPVLGARMPMTWSVATVRPISIEMTIEQAFVPGLEVGTFESPELDASGIGSFELECPWELTLPYPLDAVDWIAMIGRGLGDVASSIYHGR